MLNPITYTEKVARDFLRYQLSAYPLADERMQTQMRQLLNLEETRSTPLLKGPYVSLSRMFRQGASVVELIEEGLFHPHMERIVPHSHLYGHQESAIRNIRGKATTLVSTGTGSGKTEAFLYPIISRCLELRDSGEAPGITAVIIYPMNALAEDQLGRLRELLCGTGITFGLYVGKTPESAADVSGVRLEPGASRASYQQAMELERRTAKPRAVHPPEERVTREEMRAAGRQPRILLTNVKQLELLLTRQRDVELFDDARLEFLVVDEAHTFSGAMGAETACLIRRLRAYCNRDADQTVCVATSATIADPTSGPGAAQQFAARFFGVDAANVELVNEEYQEQTWAEDLYPTPPPSGDPLIQLDNVLHTLRSVEHDQVQKSELDHLKTHLQTLLGARIDMSDWRLSLYKQLSNSETIYEISRALAKPRSLVALCKYVGQKVGREIHAAEVLMWLALGAAARKNQRPLLRPVVHAFLRGVDGAVVTLPKDHDGPRLWLAAQDAVDHQEDLHRLPVTTCTTCGQHYFEHQVADFHFLDAEPGGGTLLNGARLWEPLETSEGNACRVVLLDRLAFNDDLDDDEDAPARDMKRLAAVHFCRHCGALHSECPDMCGSCGRPQSLVELFVVKQKKEHPGHLTSCVVCKRPGRSLYGRYREPARPIRAVNVSDIHVLAQSMLQHAQRKRLLIFADNRQDAAFQAGWMQDHARRFRLRAIIDELLKKHQCMSTGDLVFELDNLLNEDDNLSRALIPEVWRAIRKEKGGTQHQNERRKYLRLQVLRELTMGNRQRIGLEPWGRIKIRYLGLRAEHPFFHRWSSAFGLRPEELVEGIASLLDVERRKNLLYDQDTELFSRYWSENSQEVERGYIPLPPAGPQGLKLRRLDSDRSSWVRQLISAQGVTAARQTVTKWGLKPELREPFLEELWDFLTIDTKILVPVTLMGVRGTALPDCAGVHQIDVDKLQIMPHSGSWVCRKCRQSYARRAPHDVCMGWNCDGTTEFQPESDDDYDLMLLKEQFTMVRPREHSAQVPADEREVLERTFKDQGERINILVSTPTLELGVDIGSLDSVLMRNVPPQPANYWQRAGRAGRRHRMAVNLTYARPVSHDRAYFEDPLKMLDGLISPPSFNLKNEVMVRKHVHSTVLSILHKWSREAPERSSLHDSDRQEIAAALTTCFPGEIRGYLFDSYGNVRRDAFDTRALVTVTTKHGEDLLAHVVAAFSQGWPAEDQVVVEPERLRKCIDEMSDELNEVILRLRKRLNWALAQIERLTQRRQQQGTLDPEDDALWRRSDTLVKKLKGQRNRRNTQAEGIDDTNTYAVLAAEGYLPGYGLDSGAVAGTYLAPPNAGRMRDWTLRRAPSLALREYVPGNLIYANGHRFAPRHYQLEPEDPTVFQVDISNQAVREEGSGTAQHAARMGAQYMAAIPVCDVQLPHHASISDDEDYRFQLSSATYGYELKRHDEGRAYRWGTHELLWRRSVHMRLVNVGPANLIAGGQPLGFPICTVCGQSRSPFISEKAFEEFQQAHTERCGQPAGRVGIFADVVADALTLQKLEDRINSYSLLEALRHGASRVLEMELDDLQLLAIGHPGGTAVDMVLYDPMPGGSGLLDQMLERWDQVIQAALTVVQECSSDCDSACIDCLLNYRNTYYHRHLNRHHAIEMLKTLGESLAISHDIPARLPDDADREEPTNYAESLLETMLLRAGFPRPQAQKPIDLGLPLGRTLPDFFYDAPSENDEGICIYLDGQGKYATDPKAVHDREQSIRHELEARGYHVIAIPFSALHDQTAMTRHFQKLARILLGKDRARAIREDSSWFESVSE